MGALLNGVCRLLAGAKSFLCANAQQECRPVDDALAAGCDHVETITQTICDRTRQIAQTICDRSGTVTQTICDTFQAIPFIGDLICILSHAVSRVVCLVAHTIQTTICTASHVVSISVCLGGQLASKGFCLAWTLGKAAGCLTVGAAADLTCGATSLLLGPGPILRSVIRKVPSVPRGEAYARSFVLATNLPQGVDSRAPYDEEGVAVRYRIQNGVVEWSIGTGPFRALAPRPTDPPPFATSTPAGPIAVSYNRLRLGVWGEAPEFDMIAASSDRAIAKRVGTDELFIIVTANPYFHTVGRRSMTLPQSYFKLDPELGLKSARPADLVTHVTIAGDDERHPSTERFPLFRKMFTIRLGVPVPAAMRPVLQLLRINVPQFEGAGEAGLIQEMDVRFAPRIWHQMDLRPTRNANEPPRRFPSYEHIVYAANPEPGAQQISRRSVSYTKVLDLGVGLSHYHEQHDNRFGGELDNLTDAQWSILGFAIGMSDDAAYQFANGPIQDYGGWMDGTCIYYQLVQLKPDEDIDVAKPTSLRDAYAILWTDEQTAFTERWRVLHTVDNRFNSPFKPMVGIVADAPERFYPGSPFDDQRYWCPLTEGHVIPTSRMAVSRQYIALTGMDPATRAPELYTVHFAWPTMDRTWRWRQPPGARVQLTGQAAPIESEPVVYLDTLRLREDSTILFRGSVPLSGRNEPGVWFQRVLPATGQEVPAIPEREADRQGTKPTQSYSHPWDFVADGAASVMDQDFSHFGVYEPVHSRVQFYRVTLEDPAQQNVAAIEATVWEDTRHLLRHLHQRLDWGGTARILDGGNPDNAIVTRTHPSVFNDPMAFRIVQRPGLGWIMTHFDKRDDKLVSFDGVGASDLANIVLTDRDDPSRSLQVTVQTRLRNDVRQLHGRRVQDEVDSVSPPQVSRASITTTLAPNGDVAAVTLAFEMARGPAAMNGFGGPNAYAEWLAMNVWRVKVGAIMPGSAGVSQQVRLLLDRVRATDFVSSSPTRFTTIWNPTAGEQQNGRLAEILSRVGRVRYGTSVWFVGSTGLACCADELIFANAAG